jgi:hypothetical protein
MSIEELLLTNVWFSLNVLMLCLCIVCLLVVYFSVISVAQAQCVALNIERAGNALESKIFYCSSDWSMVKQGDPHG